MTLKRSLKVIKTGVPFESLSVVSFSPSIATMAVSLTVYSTPKYSMTLKTGLGLFKVIENGAVR